MPLEPTMTVKNEGPRLRAPFLLYYALVVLGASVLLVRFTPQAAPQPLMVAGMVLLLMLLADAKPVSLPSGGYATASGLFDLPSLVVLGPVYTAWLSIVSTLVNEGLIQRRPAVRVVHNLAIFTITCFAAAWGFGAAGGRVGSMAFPHDLPAMLACGAAYFITNSILVSTVIGLTSGPSPWRVWQSNFLRGILHHLSFIALGSLVVVVYFYVGPWALVLFGVPFLVARHSFGLYMEIKHDLKDFVRALTEVLEEIDPYTRHHSVRVAQYAVRLARGLKLSEREVEEVEYAALVHDIGKIGPQHQHILQKPGTLSQEEQRTLRGHPGAGADIVARVRALRRAAEIVRSHHERPDGLGYPLGLKSEHVPVGARILNVSDAFDAMTSDRPYRRALSLDDALRELERGAGTQFDANVVGCLKRMQQQGRFDLLPSPSSEDLLMLRVRPLRARG